MIRHHESPWSLTTKARAARDAYLLENGWTLEAYDAKTTAITFLRFALSVPNTPKHRWAIRLHDLHHVATGFGTDAAGESEVSAWELARGLGGLDLYVASIIVALTLYGFVHSPLRTWRALRGARGRNLFTESDDEAAYEKLLQLSVEELRAYLGLPAEGVARGPRRLHPRAPRAVTTPSSRSGSAAPSS